MYRNQNNNKMNYKRTHEKTIVKQFAIRIDTDKIERENTSYLIDSYEVCIDASCERIDIMEEAIVEIVKSLNFDSKEMNYLIGLLKKEIK